MPHSLGGLLLLALIVPLVAVGMAYVLHRLGILNERMKKRHNIVLHLVAGGLYIVSGVVALVIGVQAWFPVFFFIMGTWWVVYGLWLRRAWRERVEEPVGSSGPP